MNLTKHSNMDNSTIQYYNTNAKDYFENTVNLDLTQFYDPFLELIPEQGKKYLMLDVDREETACSLRRRDLR